MLNSAELVSVNVSLCLDSCFHLLGVIMSVLNLLLQ